jgi:hypothetical protein
MSSLSTVRANDEIESRLRLLESRLAAEREDEQA